MEGEEGPLLTPTEMTELDQEMAICHKALVVEKWHVGSKGSLVLSWPLSDTSLACPAPLSGEKTRKCT